MATYNAFMPCGRKLAMRRGRWLATSLLSSLVLLAPADEVRAQVLPGGFTSVAGGGSISYSLPGTLGINQPTSTPFIGNWQSFDIGAGGLVTFNQPSATAVGLNRVIDVNRSELSGALDIDGVGVLVNAGGAIFSSGSLVTARSFIASTLDITNTDFVDGNYLFEANDADVVVVDGGASVVAAAGGSIALIGSAVDNRGAIEALGGSINLVSAATVQLDIDANGLVGIVGAPAAAATADIKNSGVLDATGGTVSLYSRGLAGGDIFNSGIIRANLLTGGANGSAVFEGANYIVELGNFDSGGDFALTNEQALSVTGTVISTGGNVALETKLGAMTIDGDVSGDDVALRSAGALRINRSVTGASLVLAAGGDIVIDGTVEGSLTTLTTRRLIVGSSAAHSDALLQSALTIGSGMTLAGHGTVGSTTIALGGTIAPGSSIGTLKVDGDLFIEDGARYELEVDPSGTASDLISVSGSATLNGGSVAHIGAIGAYRPGSTYRILTAGTGLVGEFTAVTSDFAFLTPEFVYDYTAFTVDLMLARNGVDFADKAATGNQLSTAGGIESLGSGNDVYDAVAALPGDDALIRAVFDQLSGEVQASLRAWRSTIVASFARRRCSAYTLPSTAWPRWLRRSCPMPTASRSWRPPQPMAGRYGATASAPGAIGTAMATPPRSSVMLAASSLAPTVSSATTGGWACSAATAARRSTSTIAVHREPATTSISAFMVAANGAIWPSVPGLPIRGTTFRLIEASPYPACPSILRPTTMPAPHRSSANSAMTSGEGRRPSSPLPILPMSISAPTASARRAARLRSSAMATPQTPPSPRWA